MKHNNYPNTNTTRFNRWMLFAGIAMLSLFATGVNAQVTVTGCTGGGDGTYGTLGAAMTAIGTAQPAATIGVSITASTTETAIVVIGAGTWTSMTITPSGGAWTITGSLATELIQFNGADNVTVDGLNSGGNALTISNTSTATTSGTSTIKFQQDATSNTITNCSIQGSATMSNSTNGGVIFISTAATGGTGNDNNTISSCDIGPAGANLPSKLIHGNGSNTNSGISNSNVTITNCNLHDYFLAGGCAAIYISTGNVEWNVTNNKIYQSASRAMTSTMYGVYHSNSSFGSGVQITGNTIGYASNSGTGTLTTTGTGSFQGIYYVGQSTAPLASNINGNTISDISMTSSSGTFYGIYNASSASSNTINIDGNTIRNIGLVTTTGSCYGIHWTSATNISVSNNNIYSITRNAAGTIYGAYSGSSSVNETVSGNSIYDISNTGASASTIYGIYQLTASGTKLFQNNTVYNLTGNGGTSLYGMSVSYGTTLTMSGNTVYGLTNTGGTAGVIYGINRGSTATTASVYQNKVYGLSSTSTGPSIYGVYVAGGTTTNVYNNLVGDLTATAANSATPVTGIYISGGTTVNVYYNTVNLSGTSSGALFGSTALYASSTPTLDLRNNILVNNCTPVGALGFASAYRRSTTTLTTHASTSNNNMFYAGTPGANNVIFYDGTLGYAMGAFKSLVAPRESASVTENPTFTSTTGSSSDFLHVDLSVATQAESGGTVIAGYTTDFDGDTRNATTPDMGADEFAGIAADFTAPSISYTALGNGDCTGSRTFTATITDASGVDITSGTSPRVYYKNAINANADGGTNDNTTDGWKYVETASTSSPFTFTIDASLLYGGIGSGDLIQYFVVAQDLAGPTVGINSGTFAAAQSSVALAGSAFPIGGTINSYTISTTALSVTSSATPSSLCVSGISNISAFPLNGTPGYTYSWSPGGATTATVSTGSISADATYTVTVTDGCGATATSSTTVTVNNPSVTGTTPDSRCGTGSLSLQATGSSGTTLDWFAASSGGASLGTGSPFATPTISSTTTYYVAASVVGATTTPSIGAGLSTSSSSGISPYYHGYGGQKSQFIILASELTSAGISAGTINSVAFEITALGTTTLNGFAVSIGHTAQSAAVANTAIGGLTQVYSNVAQTLSLGLNTYAFGPTFTWDGASNIVVQVCYSNNNSGGSSSTVKTDAAAFTGSLGIYADNATSAAVCAATSSTGLGTLSSNTTSTSRPRMTFSVTGVCASARTAVTATVSIAPLINPITGTTTICDGQSTTLTASSSNPDYSYTWTPGGSTSAAVTVSPSSSTTYTVNAIDNTAGPYAGCTDVATQLVTVNASPTAVTVSPSSSTVCVGGSQALVASGANYLAVQSNSIVINLSNPSTDETTSCPGANLIGSFTLPATPGGFLGAHLTMTGVGLTSGSYASEVRLSFSGSGISGVSSCYQGATSSTAPNPFDWATGTNVAGDTATLAALFNVAGGNVDVYYNEGYNDNTGGPDATFPATATIQYYYTGLAQHPITWTPAASGLDVYAGANVVATPSATTVYTATATHPNGCTASGSATVSITDLAVSGTPTAATCFGATDGSIVASGSGGTPAYEYSLDGTNFQSSTTFSGLAAGTYTLYVKDAQPCTTSVAGVVVGSPAQLVVSASNNGPICDGANLTLTATSGFTSYSWSGPNAHSDNVNPSVITGATLAANGTYTVTVSDGTCSETATTDVTVNPIGAITVSLASGLNPSCDGGSVTFTATPTNALSPTYDFYLNTVSVQNSASDTYSYVPTTGDQLYVILTGSGSGCATGSPATSNTVTQTVNSNPAAPTITPSGPTTFCANIGSVDLLSNYVGGNTWSTNATTDGITVSTSGSYTVTFMDGNGCIATSAPTVVTANTSSAVIVSSNPGGLCTGAASVTLTATATPAATDYLWSPNSEITQAITASVSGTYDVVTTDANGCTAMASSVVVDVAIPTASIGGSATICTGTTETLTATATAGSGTITTYQWVLNGSTNVGLNQDTYDATAIGSYTVIVTNSNGCSVTSAAHVLATAGPLSGSYTIGSGPASCTNFTSFASAMNDLNTLGVAGNVVFTVASGYTETAPAGGLVLNQCALSVGLRSNSSQTISFVSAGAPNPVITAAVGTSTTLDGIVKLVGADYVTFNGINLAESAGNTTATTQAEWGYALLKCDGNNGANYNTIFNCSITLNKANTNSRAIYSGNHTAASTTGLTYTGLAGDPAEVNASRNGNNTFYGNAIQNSYGAISLNGNSATSSGVSLNDTLNAIGVIGQSANVITNFGGAATVCTVVASTNQRGITIDNNTITGGTGTTTTMTGINPGSGSWGKIRNNNLTLVTSATTSTITGIAISFSGGSLADPNIVMVTGNTVTMSSTTQTTGAATGITCTASGTGAQITVRSNTVSGCTFTGTTSGAFNGITQTHSSASTINDVSKNTVSSNNRPGTGQFMGIMSFSGNAPTLSTLSMDSNTVSLNTKGSTGSMFCIYNGVTVSASLTMTQNGNTVNGNVITGGTLACTLVGITAQATNFTMNGNTVTNNSVTAVTGTGAGNVLAIQSSGASTATSAITNNTVNGVTLGGVSSGASLVRGILATSAVTDNRTISGNDISNVSTSNATSATCIGIITAIGGNTNIYKNKVYDFFPGQNSTVFSGAKGIIIAGGTSNNVYNNHIGFDYSSVLPLLKSNNCVVGLEVSGGTAANLHYNTVRLAGAGSDVNFGSSGINLTVTTTDVTIKNNLILNLLNAGSAAQAVGLRRTATALTGYNSASNNNIWYAGVASSTHPLYYDGTNRDQTMAAFQARVGPAESGSQTENTALLSTVGSNANFLHVDASYSTLAESGGMAITGVDDDYDSDIRQGSIGYAGTGTSPDIGADEFGGIALAPAVTNLTVPVGGCSATSHIVSADVTTGAGTIDSVRLNYSFGAIPQTAMMLYVPTAGNTYTFTIPAATPTNAVVSWSVTGFNSGGYTSTAVGTSYQDDYLNGVQLLVSASADTVCAGEDLTLTAFIGNPAPAPTGYCTNWATSTADEDIGLVEFGSLSNGSGALPEGSNPNAISPALATSDYTALPATVIGVGVPTPMAVSIINSSTTLYACHVTVYIDYNKNGVFDANEVALDGQLASGVSPRVVSGSVTIPAWASLGKTRMRVIATETTSAIPLAACGSFSWGEVEDYTIDIVGSAGFAFNWTDGSNNYPGDLVTIQPTPAGTYTYVATATDANTCAVSSSGLIVEVLPIPVAPTATDSTQCGNGVPFAYVQGTSGAVFNWYDAAVGGNLLQSGTDTTYLLSINATTTWYVSEFGTNGCDGDRVAVTETVTSPDPIDAQVNFADVCPDETVELSVIQTGANNTYNYTWTAEPAAGSGISGTLIGNPVSATPSIPNTYNYVVTAVDIALNCVIQDSVYVLVNNVPDITSVAAVPDTACSGYPVVLTALTPDFAAGIAQVGTGVSTTSGEPNPYYTGWWGNKNQYLILASELTAAGLYAGNITSMGLDLRSVTTTLNLDNFTISMGNSALTALPATFQTGLTQVYTTPSYSVIANANTLTSHPFSTAFYWNGTSNIVIETCFNNGAYNGAQTIPYTTTAFSSALYYYADVATVCSAPGTPTTSSNRPNLYLGGTVVGYGTGTYTWNWEPGSLSGNEVTAYPTASTNYTVTATDPATTCTNSATVNVFVNPTPPAPTAFDGSHCGIQTPTCYVTRSEAGTTFSWYTDAVGGSPLAGQSDSVLVSYPLIVTDTFYVSETYATGPCEGPRVMVIETYVNNDAITATATVPNDTICPFGTVALDATQGTSNTYTSYEWTTIPAGGTATGQNTTAAAPNSPGQVIWQVTASDGSCIAIAYDTITVASPPDIYSLVSDVDSICPGTNVTLTALTTVIVADTIRIGTGTSTTTSTPSPLYVGSSGHKGQYLITAAQLSSQNFVAGDITELSLLVTSATTPAELKGYTVSMTQTNDAALTTTWLGGLSTVYGPVNYTPSVGVNSYPFSTPFTWNGTSNLLVQICFDNDAVDTCTVGCTGTTSTIRYTASAGYTASHYWYANNVGQSLRNMCDTTYTGFTSSNLPHFGFTAQKAAYTAGSVNWTWNPGSLSGNSVVVTPSVTTIYTVTAADPNPPMCYNEQTITVFVHPEPLAPINPVDLTQCGSGVPLISVTRSGDPSDTFNWYTVSSGGTALAGETDSVLTSLIVSATTTFYVSETNGYCEGPRTAVTVTVNLPDLVVIGASATSVCAPSPTITLSADQTGNTSNYVFTWSVNPSATAGLSGTSGDTVYMTPTATGNYTVTLSAVDAGASCALIVDQIIAVNEVPVIATVSANPDTICAGESVDLFANSLAISSDTVRIGTGTTGFSGAANPYYRNDEGFKAEFLIKGTALQAAGLFAGNITELSNIVTTAVVGQNNLNGYTIKMAHTAATALTTTFQTASYTTVFGPVNYSPVTGLNIHAFSTPFAWNGSSNVLVTVCYDNDPTNNACTTGSPICYGNNPSVQYTSSVGYAAAHYYTADNTSSVLNRNMCDTSGTVGSTQTNLPNFGFRGQKFSDVSAGYAWTWEPGSLSGNSVSVTPASTTTYTVTAAAGVCTDDTTVTVVVNPLPATPTAVNSVQCGYGPATCSVTGGGGPYQWYVVGGGVTYLSNSINVTLTNPGTDEGDICPGGIVIGSFTLPSIPGPVIGARLTIPSVTLVGGTYGSEITLNFTGSGISGISPCYDGATSSTAPNPVAWITGQGYGGLGDTASLAALLNVAGGTIDIYYSEGYNDDAFAQDATFPASATFEYIYQAPPTAPTLIVGQTADTLANYFISETTTFYVTEFNGTCTSDSVAVTATVNPVDTVTATLSNDSICLGASTDLIAVQTGSVANIFTYTWTVSPDTSVSGITGSASGTPATITPTAEGTYVYTVNSVDGACNALASSVTLVVAAYPTVDVGPDLNVCSGSTITLTAQSPSFIPSLRLTELMHQGFLTPGYNGVKPAYIPLASGGNDLVEVTNLGSAPTSPVGVSLEVWLAGGTIPAKTITIPSGAVNVPSGGSVFFQWGSPLVQDLANNYYTEGAGSLDTYTSGQLVGYLIKKDGLIIDAVGVNSFVWPVASGVTASDWSGNIASMSGQAGSVLTANDNNTASSWTPTSALVQSSYGTINPGVTATLAPLGNVVWSSDPAGFSGSTAEVSAGPITSNTTYIATLTNDFGCATSDSVEVTVSVSGGVATITSDPDTICASGTANLTATGLALGATIQWQTSTSGLIDTWTDIVGADTTVYTTPTLTASTFYRVYATCSTTDTSAAYEMVVAAPTVSGTNASRCGVGLISLGATSNGDVSWYTSSSGGAALFTGSPYVTTVTGTTVFWLEANIGTCVNTTRVGVVATVTTAPSVDFTTSASSVCEGTQITLTATSTNGDYTFYWSTTDSTIEFTGNPYVLTPTATASYYLLAIDSSGNAYDLCGAIALPQQVVVNYQPIAPIVSPSMTTICVAGDSTLLTVTNPPPATPGLVQIGTGVTTGSGQPNPYYTTWWGNKNQYLILASELTSAGLVAGNITNMGLNLGSVTTTLDLTNFTISMGNTALTAMTAAFETGLTQVYTTPSYSVIANANSITSHALTPFYWNGSSNIIVETCFNNSGWNGSQTIAYTTTAFTSAVYYNADIATVCSAPGAPTTSSNRPNFYFNALTGTPVVYTWNPGGATGASLYVTPTASTIYTVTATVGPCSATGTAQVDYTPINLVITPSGPTTLCGPGSVDLDAGAGYANYSWSDGVSTIGTTQMITVSPSVTTSYTATVDSGACTVSQTIDVTVHPSVVIGVTPSSVIPLCGGVGNITLTADAGYTNYLWSPSGGTYDTLTVSPVSTTTYTVTADDIINGCTQTGTYTVVSNPSPATPTIMPDGPICLCWDSINPGTPFVQLIADTTGAGAGATIEWNDIFLTQDTFIDVYAADYLLGPQTFTITVSNSFNCQSTASVVVNIDNCSSGLDLDLTLFLEGYYLGGNTMITTLYDLETYAMLPGPYATDATDSIEVNLWSQAAVTANIAPDYSEKVILHSDGTASVNFPTATPGNYYVAVKHRNSMETWSSDSITMSPCGTEYDFSNSLSKAYDDGNPPMQNMGGGVFAIYGGDINQDGEITGLDMNDIDNNVFGFGYDTTDVTGDVDTNGLDMNIVDNNAQLFLFYARPY